MIFGELFFILLFEFIVEHNSYYLSFSADLKASGHSLADGPENYA